jgi:hypothetical protein
MARLQKQLAEEHHGTRFALNAIKHGRRATGAIKLG